MWPFFVKDVKENARWAALAAMLLSALVAFLLFSDRFQRQSVVYAGYQTDVCLAFAVTGVALGMVLMFTDLRRGHWGFAVHRPVRRWKLFAAKWLAGVVLYGVASAAATVVAALCAMDKRFVDTPFAASMLLPQLYYALAGVVWVSAGMLVAVRQARWFGSRLFPAALPLVGMTVVMTACTTFTQAVPATIALAAVTAVAAGAYFVHNGQYAPQPRWAKVLQTLFVAGGVAVLLGGGLNVMTAAARLLHGNAERIDYETYRLDTQGNCYRSAGNGFFTLQGGKLNAAQSKWLGENLLDHASVGTDSSNRWPVWHYGSSFLDPERFIVAMPNYSGTDTVWAFVPARRTVEALDLQGNAAGSLGPDGFRDAARTPQPFPPGSTLPSGGQGQPTDLLITNDAHIFIVNRDDRTTHEVFTAAPGQRAISADSFRRTLADVVVRGETDLFDPRRPGYLTVALPGHVRVLPLAGQGDAFDVPTTSNREGDYAETGIADDGGLRVLLSNWNVADEPVRFLTVWPGGRTTTLDLPPSKPYAPVLGPEELIIAVALPPLAMAAAELIEPTRWHAWVDPLPAGLGWMAAAVVIVSVALTVWLGRRRTFGRSQWLVWLPLAAVFGLHAPLTMICLRERAVRVRCPACGRMRPVDRDRCPACGAAFAGPRGAATDVFADGRDAA